MATKKKAAVKKTVTPKPKKNTKKDPELKNQDQGTAATIESEDGETIPCAANEREIE